ncbi:MAG: DEAD/DEAH box helicase [Aigarchaeota archaeon]|nr:DEAD/DEAH box helicase [Aigarchaeota archaeon]MDW8093196.1 DEAD/DEAH box helicase [Nitrososphaerota archaeon]
MEGSALELLAKPVRETVIERFGKLTEPQELAIPRIVRGENVLLMAPTGSGKTEAALLPIYSALVTNPRTPRIAALYVTPLRALNRDLLDRVAWWSQRLDISVAVRHGDTSAKERRTQSLAPPHLLISTPETLQSLIIGRVMRRYLSNVRWVIIDEVHELAGDKRGAQLSVALSRLRAIKGGDFQVIGLSATVGNSEEVAQYLVGVGRPFSVVRVSMVKDMDVTVMFPVPDERDKELSEMLGVAPDVAARMRVIKELVDHHTSTLIFTNTRPLAEILANRFRAWSETYPISIHHGSLARDRRLTVERGLKEGDLTGLICTSSLELGIDVGRIDLCIQYNSPREVARLIQRIGRSGHSIGRRSKGIVIVMDSDDALEAMVIGRRASREEIEPTPIPINSLDVLMHQLAGVLIERGNSGIGEFLSLLRGSFNFKEISEDDVLDVARFMQSIGLARVDEAKGVISRPPKREDLFNYYFGNLSMIPEEKQYIVINEEKDEIVGILDESFIAEYGEPGTRFVLGSRSWVILSLMEDRVYVSPLNDYEGTVPSWVGDEIPVPYEVAQEVGFIRRRYKEGRSSGLSHGEIVSILAREYNVSEDTMSRSLREVAMHVDMGLPVPTDREVLVERSGDFTVLHVHGGLKINRTIGRVLVVSMAEKIGATIFMQSDPYRVVFRSKHVDPYVVISTVNDVVSYAKERFEQAIETSGVFKRRLIHVARKMGAIGKEASITDVNFQKFIESIKSTPIYREALRFSIFTDFDVGGAMRLLKMISDGAIRTEIHLGQKPTPLASLTIDRYLYEYERFIPERIHRIVINAVKGRLMSEQVVLLCAECMRELGTHYVGDLEPQPSCTYCESRRVGVIKVDERRDVSGESYRGRGRASIGDKRLLNTIRSSSELVERYGKAAVVTLVGKGLSVRDAEEILEKEPNLSYRLIELIVEAEKRKVLARYH